MKHIQKLFFPAFVLLVLLAALAGCEDQHVHSMGDWSVTTPATCTAAGEERRDCAGCEHFETKAIAATGHTYATEWTIDTPATCTAVGNKSLHCADCEAKALVTEISIAAHSFGEWSATTAATCTTAGAARRDCANCEHYETKELAATGHSFGAWSATTAATCTAAGEERRDCANCEHFETKAIAATGHTYATEWTIDTPATCTAVGSKSLHCADCEAKALVTEIPIAAHSFGEWSVTTAATCTTAGAARRDCANCEHYETKELAATGHSFGEWSVTTAATCTAAGEERRDCAGCEHFETKAIAATGHTYATEWTIDTPATCTAVGSKSLHCADCEAKALVTEIPSAAHSFGEWSATTAATCTTAGAARRDCANCEHYETKELAATGHSFGAWSATTAATCTAAGKERRDCANCEHFETKAIAAAGHTYATEWTIDTPATCTAVGSKSLHCADCEAKALVTEIPIAAHSFGEWSVTTAATCTTAGAARRDCANCEHYETKELAATWHTYATEWTNDETHHWHAATCEHAGEFSEKAVHDYDANYVCKVCAYVDTSLHGVEIEAAGFVKAGNNYSVTLPNATELYSFADTITVSETASLAVYRDAACTQRVTSKIVSLLAGNNVFYVSVTNGEERAVYTFTIRRRPIYTVNFNTKGSSVPAQQIEEGNTAIEPDAPTRGGAVFAGWNFDFGTPITEGKTIVAKWQLITYNVTYNLNGGTNAAGNPTSYTVESMSITLANPTRTGYTFKGWTEGNRILAGSTGDKTFTATWTPIVYTVTYNLNGGTNAAGNPKNYTIESDAITLANPTRTGYTFKGWTEGSGISAGSTGNKTFTATWEANTYTVVFDAGAGAVTPQSMSVIFDAQTDLPAPVSNSGEFLGWYYGETKVISGEWKIAENVTLTAKWQSFFVINNSGIITGLTTAGRQQATLVIPSEIDGRSVVGIGERAIYYCGSLKSITIPSSVTSIDDCAFYNCTSLVSITLPLTVTSIGASAFEYCKSLTSITIPASVTSIGSSAFSDCTSLATVTFADGSRLESIGIYAFENCKSLVSITIPSSVTSIGEGAFSGCSGLESITLPFVGGSRKTASDTYQYPFGYIFGTYKYTGGVQTTQRYYGRIINSTTSTTYYIPENLKSVIITGGEILHGAFVGCTSLTSITIPSSVMSIGSYAFDNCKNLTSITIPSSVIWIDEYAFRYCTSLASITIPSTVTSIGDYAFEYCKSLTSITIPPSVTSIGKNPFASCSGCESITVLAGNTKYHSADNCLIETATKTLIAGCKNNSIPTDGSVTSIGDSAFRGCTSLVSITIPSSVTRIRMYAFWYCTSLVSITIPSSVTSIGGDAFQGCVRLVEVYNLSSLEEDWSNAKDIYTDANAPSKLSTDAEGFLIHTDGDVKSLIAYTGNKTEITIPEGITEIYQNAFSGCTSLASITIPSSVTSIGKDAFEDTAWYNNQPDGLVYAGNVAYDYKGTMPSRTSIVLKDGTTGIADYAFWYCTGLVSITIPSSVRRIGSFAFSSCTSLTSITIPASVISIGEYAFNSCSIRTICCRVASPPSGWDSRWNPDYIPVVWGYTG